MSSLCVVSNHLRRHLLVWIDSKSSSMSTHHMFPLFSHHSSFIPKFFAPSQFFTGSDNLIEVTYYHYYHCYSYHYYHWDYFLLLFDYLGWLEEILHPMASVVPPSAVRVAQRGGGSAGGTLWTAGLVGGGRVLPGGAREASKLRHCSTSFI